jgi:hypothetical protein
VVEPAQQNRLLPENEENQLAAKFVVSGLDVKWVLYGFYHRSGRAVSQGLQRPGAKLA